MDLEESLAMFSIFDHHETTAESERKLTLGRLQQVLEESPPASAEEPPTATATAATPGPPVRAVPVVADPQPSETASIELQQFAEQFARGFLETLTRVMKDVQALLTEDRKRLGTAMEELRTNSRDVQAVRLDVTNLRLKVEAMENDRNQLTSKLDRAEQNLDRASGALRTFEETRSQVEKRLDLHAGAIRSLHDAVQSRDENLGRLLATLQAVQTAAAGATVPKALSSNL